MLRDDLINVVSRDTWLSRAAVSKVLESIEEHVGNALARGDRVQLTGFGVFEPKKRNARIGRNPHTKEAVPIPARIIPSFKPGKDLNDKVCRNIEK